MNYAITDAQLLSLVGATIYEAKHKAKEERK